MTSFIVLAILATLMVIGGSIGADRLDDWKHEICCMSLRILVITGWALLTLSLITIFAIACGGVAS